MRTSATVFLIDDDPDDHEIFSHAMGKADDSVRCLFAEDGKQAIEKIKTEHDFIPDVIFLDLNMPRLNGQQCLAELKKIERLKNTPVIMYSTTDNPEVMEQHLRMGAAEFVVKPADINVLTDVLKRIVNQYVMPMMMIVFMMCMMPGKSQAQADSISTANELKKLSVEELMNIVVTSVSKTPEKLSEVASAIQVVTNEEIKRSGALRLPGALRLATNLQVYSSGAHDTRISSRGFNGYPIANTSFGNKLLVLIDGRSVYTPLLGGVFWDVQNVLLEDVKQIEVISGPGGALWGSNAVNGIINITSKSAKETEGVYVSGAAGNVLQDFVTFRLGSHIDSSFFYRVYAQRFDINSSTLTDGTDARDGWDLTQGGFRADYIPSRKVSFTLQGDWYAGTENDTARTRVNGQNLLGRWTRHFSDRSALVLQGYFDRTYRKVPGGYTDELNTVDADMQHSFALGKRNNVLWGLGYRAADDNFRSVPASIHPPRRTLYYYSGFVQDQIAIVPERFDLTLGTKVLHNEYTGFEFHPTLRLSYFVNDKNTLWAAVSRAVRTPSRLDADIASPVEFRSENVTAYELGFRTRPRRNLSFSIAGYYNDYTDLRSLDTNYSSPPSFYFGNNLKAKTEGVEISASAIITSWWKLKGGYTWMHQRFTTAATSIPETYLLEAIDPENQFLIQSMMDVTKHFQVDGIIRYVDDLPAAFTLPSVSSYITFDLRVACNYKWLTISAVGSNLASSKHGSSGITQIPRSFYGRLTMQF